MPLYSLPGFKTTVKEDLWVISKDAEEYHFCGATLRGQLFEPNSFPWRNICFALGPNNYVVIAQTAMLLFIDGEEKARVDHNFVWDSSFKYPAPPNQRRPYNSHDDHRGLFWRQMIAYLKSQSSSSKDAARILRALVTWTRTSLRTLRWLENKIDESNWSSVEILVSDTRWLLHYYKENRLVVGNQENVWGETCLPSQQNEFQFATPTKNGWVLNTLSGRWLLQRKDDGTVELREVFFPTGEWKRLGSWIYWPGCRAILTPTNRMVIRPAVADLCGASFHWAFFSSGRNLVVIDQEGKIYEYKQEMSEQYGMSPRLWVGGSTVLISYWKDEYCCFSIVHDYDRPFRHRSREMVAFPGDTFFYIDAIQGYPDTFIVLFKPYRQNRFGVCFININGEVWVSPFLLEISRAIETEISSERYNNNQVVIEIPRYQEKSAKIRASALDDLVQIDMGEGIAIASKMARLPDNEKTALWELIKPLWES